MMEINSPSENEIFLSLFFSPFLMENAVHKGALDSVEFLNFVEKFAFLFFFFLSHSEGCLVRAVEVGLYSGRERPCMMRIWQW